MRQALELALEALEDIKDDCSGCKFEWSNDYPLQAKAHAAIKEALAQPEQEPVASIFISGIGEREFDDWGHDLPVGRNLLYTTPPQRKPLTDEQILHFVDIHVGAPSMAYPLDNSDWITFARAIEAAHGIKE